ncbi:MAG: Rpn family recombination-promoting nuclease/putative transposase [Runella slithyformis]|nr:MAG: Rpn family recombination-promoting nuclease/putative transposase [Runella slithyformis]TAG17843.1 MAG: Rpn family recombination-promoting nuclease/putative transposase [Cytophagales bacterium]TAG37548.1 MAG: Rpn family recombination-promoting nuclease/putative transposase [Cytophagia bacterium]TAG78677.1 MAG: Rpn family recombination-promoting nuclease/putative transposase [Cytophagales bacterium]
MPRYINPYTDFGFKKLFGEEANKDLLIDFLNQLLPVYHQIAALEFRNSEIWGELFHERKAIFDIHCESKTGEKFIVEMQKAKVNFFKDRSLFYATIPIREQAKKGEWDFRLTPVYMIAILDFQYDENEERQKFLRSVNLKDQDGDVFFDKLTFKFIQMPLFVKEENELKSQFDKWIYFLKKLEGFNEIPAILNEPIFEKAFSVAELAKMTPMQYEQYQESLLTYIEVKEVVKTAELDGVRKVAKELKRDGLATEKIIKYTGLSKSEIDEL